MRRDFADCAAWTEGMEGGFVDDPRDPGGATNRGVTIHTLSAWRKAPCTVQDVQALTSAEANAIYRAWYWAPVNGDGLPAGVDLMLFDYGVNRGVHTSSVLLQSVLGVPADGDIGPFTLGTLQQVIDKNGIGPTIDKIQNAQADAYRTLAEFPIYGKGWLRRTALRRAHALHLAGVT